MTKQEQEQLEQFITKLIDERLITESTEPHFLIKAKSWLMEQGTQRGIVRILSAYLILQFNLDPELALSIVGGSLALVGLHDAVTQG